MRLFMKGVMACLFLLGLVLCALTVWPAALVIWQGKILLDAEGLESLAAILPVFLIGAATCAAAAIGVAQLDVAAARTDQEIAPRPKPASSAPPPAVESSIAAPGGPAAGARRVGPNPLK